MKIQLASTLPFTPVQLDTRHVTPRRTVGQLHGTQDGVEYRLPVYEFRHSDDDAIHYKVDMSEKVFVDSNHSLSLHAANDNDVEASEGLVWMEHDDSVTYKPYSFLVMNAMSQLVGNWDGVVYRTPSGERLRESAFKATLQIIDACVCPTNGLWVMVQLSGEVSANLPPLNANIRQMGWVPVAS